MPDVGGGWLLGAPRLFLRGSCGAHGLGCDGWVVSLPGRGAAGTAGVASQPDWPFGAGLPLLLCYSAGDPALRQLRPCFPHSPWLPQSFQQGQENLAVADEAQRQLEASADCLSLKEQQAQRAGSQELQVEQGGGGQGGLFAGQGGGGRGGASGGIRCCGAGPLVTSAPRQCSHR